jgi:hypothetical protein
MDEDGDRTRIRSTRRQLCAVSLPILAGLILFVAPVAAQSASSPICDASNLPGIIEGFFQITTALGIMGLVIVWQADVVAEIFTLDPDQRKGFKRHRRTAGKSAAIVTALGPLYMVAGTIMNLPLADCVNLAPW